MMLIRTSHRFTFLIAALAISLPASAQQSTKAKTKSATSATSKPPASPKPASDASGVESLSGDAKEISEYRLTMPVLRKLAQTQENMFAATRDPALKEKYAALGRQSNDEPEPNSLDDMVKRIERVPEVKRAITSTGLTTREYMKATLSMFQAAMALSMMEMEGPMKVKTLPPGVMADNVAFLKANKAELDKMTARSRELQKLARDSSDEQEEQQPDATEPPHR
jgi:hypothetical protein